MSKLFWHVLKMKRVPMNQPIRILCRLGWHKWGCPKWNALCVVFQVGTIYHAECTLCGKTIKRLTSP